MTVSREITFFVRVEIWTLRACSSKGRIVILGRIVSASGQIFRSDFRPQDEIFRPGMLFRPLDEQALSPRSHASETPDILNHHKVHADCVFNGSNYYFIE